MSQVDTSASTLPGADDAAAALSLAAARTQRRNQPQYLVLLGVLALVGVGVWTAVKWAGAMEARDTAEAARGQAQKAMEAVAKLQAYAAAAQAGPATVAPANIRSTIESAGQRAGLKKPVGVGSQSTQRTSDEKWNQVRYAYTLRDESLAALLNWVEIVKQDIADIEVSAVSIVPEANEWRLTVTFVRFERKAEGSAT
ncbi:MAG TPA: hypothetical protein VK157_17625 [Phycisphaerales bacterium]|nr:hypothetical protein [Phycisphaerales bacterium]